ncbi:hypothetical protein G7077_03385 [Sphingomonas piscis]|uniref:Uncharacterized protein n=1 Tax=Sphingomonas piscis TaxID=2714943 RepID=A0A6G7YMY2_9SPHN|nr:hypothetical protein [Sphingomonas piscis]QIK78098.1 hypothetical protein G7077_03385 [Sphingomonas piscis]
MATQVQDAGAAPAVRQRGYMADQGFFVRYAVVLAAFIMFGFLQFAARGFTRFGEAPAMVHLHAGLMVSWLGIFIAQNLLVHKGELGIHRKLGWVSAVLAAVICVTFVLVGYNSLSLGRQPPFFSPPYFLTLTSVGALFFGGMVAWAIALRKQVQWHRRVMLGAMFMLLEPALGRLLPMPLIMPWGEWVTLAIQLIFVGVLARHDRKVLGAVHPATIAVAALLTLSHVLLEVVAILPPVVAFANGVAAG